MVSVLSAAQLLEHNGEMKVGLLMYEFEIGKGKLVDILASNYDICARYNGGANAGHTVKVEGKKYIFHLLPCGMLYPQCKNMLGNGVVVHFPTMFEELKQFDDSKISTDGRLFISNR